MYELKVKTHFDAAHQIRDYNGKCSRMHGHRWEVEVRIKGHDLDKTNILIDFSEVKKHLSFITENLDHYIINDRLSEPNVTAEFLAKSVFYGLVETYPGLMSVTVWESPECSVTYRRSYRGENKATSSS